MTWFNKKDKINASQCGFNKKRNLIKFKNENYILYYNNSLEIFLLFC